jgi:hypothetical protein
MRPDDFAYLPLPDNVRALGYPEQVFASGNPFATARQYRKLLVGFLLFAGPAALLVAVLTIPAGTGNVLQDPNVKFAVLLACGCASVFGLLLLVAAVFTRRSAVYALYADGMAVFDGRRWELVGWATVDRYEAFSLRAAARLVLRDGSKVSLHDGDPQVADALHAEVRRRVRVYHRTHPEVAAAIAAERAAAGPVSRLARHSYISQMAAGVLLVAAGGWLYHHLARVEAGGDDGVKRHAVDALAEKVGGKEAAAGLVGLVGAGLFVAGLRRVPAGDGGSRESDVQGDRPARAVN